MTNVSIDQAIGQPKKEKTESLKWALQSHMGLLETCDTPEILMYTIFSECPKIVDQYKKRVTAAAQATSIEDHSHEEAIWLFQYELPESFKDLLILHRDIYLQMSIAHHKFLDGNASEKAVKEHFIDSRGLLLEATKGFIRTLVEKTKNYRTDDRLKRKITTQLKHHKSPWSVYESQFADILEHLERIDAGSVFFRDSLPIFQAIEAHSNEVLKKMETEAQEESEKLKVAIDRIQNGDTDTETLSILKEIAKGSHESLKSGLSITATIESNIDQLGKGSIPTESQDGFLVERMFDLNKIAKRWVDFKLVPLFMDLWDIRRNLTSTIDHFVLNVKGGYSLLENEKEILSNKNLGSTLKDIRDSFSKSMMEQRRLSNEIQNLLETQFKLSKIYGKNPFLEVSFQTSITQYSSDTGHWLTNIKERFLKFWPWLNQGIETKMFQGSDTPVDRAIRCINYRMFKETNAHYDLLFLNKTFIGEIFIAPRQREEERLETALEQWEQGFGQAVLLLGNPLSGKTTFLHHVPIKLTQRRVVHLEPNAELTLEGRKFQTTKDLKEILNEIKKFTYVSKMVLVIDNLEQWHDAQHSLAKNLRALFGFIDRQAEDVFVIASTTKNIYPFLLKKLGISTHFSSVIDMERCSNEVIKNAVFLRHGATNKKLVDTEGNAMPQKTIENYIGNLAKRYGHNLGEVLQAWTFGTTVSEDNKVIYNDEKLGFPDFFTKKEAVLLKYFALFGQTNELLLKHFIGPEFVQRYGTRLRRLLNIKVILRDGDGQLEINPVVAHDTFEILKNRGILE